MDMRILVVDDDPTALALLEAALATYGFTKVETASSAIEALSLIKRARTPYDLFLLDYRMPEIDGAHLCAQIRRFSEYQDTPVIFVTAMSDRSSINTAYAVGAVDYVAKPIDPQEIGVHVAIAEKMVLETRMAQSGREARRSLHEDRIPRFDIAEPVPIFNVTGVIGRVALDNYIQLIAQNEPDDIAVSAIAINEFEEILETCSPAAAYTVIVEVAKIIADSLKRSASILSYNGYGEFLCVSKNTDLSGNGGGHTRRINSRIVRARLVDEDENPIEASVTIGRSAHPDVPGEATPDRLIAEALTVGAPDHAFRSQARRMAGASASPSLNL